jgi:hypothetical protein
MSPAVTCACVPLMLVTLIDNLEFCWCKCSH